MAGVKGKSGGARSGAGRKAKPATYIEPPAAQMDRGEPLDPLPTLELIALGHMEVSAQQFRALTALLPYTNVKKGEGGKKDAKDEAAKKAGAGKFASAPPPLKLVGGR